MITFGLAMMLQLSPLKIGEGAIIGYGTVVRRDVEPLSIYIGNPAIKVSERIKNHTKRRNSQTDFADD